MRTPTETRRTLLSHGVSLLVHIPCFYHKNLHKSSSPCYFSQLELISGVKMHIFRQEIWCIEDGGADSILRMKVLTIRDVFILNFAPVSLSVSTPRTPRVCHAFQQQATDNCRVGQTATQDMSCMQSKVCSTAQELTGSQHSSWNIVHKLSPQPALRKQEVFSSSECFKCQCTRGQYSLKGRPMICWVFYQSAVQLCTSFFR